VVSLDGDDTLQFTNPGTECLRNDNASGE